MCDVSQLVQSSLKIGPAVLEKCYNVLFTQPQNTASVKHVVNMYCIN